MAADLAQFNAAFPWFFPAAVAVFGACVGSFLNVVILRVPREESVVSPGSHCGCGAPIRWHDNIPVLSWLLLRGRARCCGRPFSFRYAFVELLTAASRW
jgi:leader peptidase (prepilin peptidase)/N-methyltransferase